MSLTLSISQTAIFTALKAWLETVVDPSSVEVIRGQDNLVPMPKGEFILMTQKGMDRISTPVEGYTDPGAGGGTGTMDIMAPTQFDISLDFYGANSADTAAMVQALFRNAYGDIGFPDSGGIKPLYAETPIQIPLVDGEQNYTQRWRVVASLQYNPVIKPAQQFADVVTPTIISVERTYPA